MDDKTLIMDESNEATISAIMALSDLVEQYAPGSFSAWDEQEADMLARICLCCGEPGHYQRMLEAHLAEHGLDQGVCLGSDGRVWDGNHRIVAARRLGIERIPLESEDDAGRRWVRDHGPVGWLERKWGDITASEMSWIVADALTRVIPCPGSSGSYSSDDNGKGQNSG